MKILGKFECKRQRQGKSSGLFSCFDDFCPDIFEIFLIVGLLIIGALISNVVMTNFLSFMKTSEYLLRVGIAENNLIALSLLLSYPVIFLPAILYSYLRARYLKTCRLGMPSSLSEKGPKPLDSDLNFGKPLYRRALVLMAALCTVGVSFIAGLTIHFLPQMPQALKDLLQVVTKGSFIINFISVAVFAPFFEEWLCRGMIFRSLLNSKRLSPFGAVIISSIFFALIHLNPWQAIPAFFLGCLFAYVYYKTGSLKLTILMHSVNNTLALIIGKIPSLKDFDDDWFAILPLPWIATISIIIIVFMYVFVALLKKYKPGSYIQQS